MNWKFRLNCQSNCDTKVAMDGVRKSEIGCVFDEIQNLVEPIERRYIDLSAGPLRRQELTRSGWSHASNSPMPGAEELRSEQEVGAGVRPGLFGSSVPGPPEQPGRRRIRMQRGRRGRFLDATVMMLLVAPLLACGQTTGHAQSEFHDSVRPPLGQEGAPREIPLHVPTQISECEGGQCGVWELSEKAGTAHWPSGAQATLTVERFGFEGITIRRQDKSGSTPGFIATYTGKVVGNQIFGEELMSWPGHWSRSPTGTWAATIVAPADYNIIDTSIACDPKYSISPKEALARGELAMRVQHAPGAACWLRIAAGGGDATARGLLATLLWEGVGIVVNLPEAADLAQKSAQQGNFIGEACLSLMYETGQGLPKDLDKAQFWRAKAEQDKLISKQVEQQEQQQLAQLQQQARTLQAQQSHTQQLANVASAKGQSAVERNLQTLARMAAMFNNSRGAVVSVKDSEARISSLKSQVQDARYECHLIRGEKSACDRWAGLQEDLDDAEYELRQYTEELCSAQKTLPAQCSSGNQDACRKWDKIKGEVAQLGCFR
jgi:TPR repeat protein